MKIAFYAPFKPLGHKNPSGDLAIAQSIVDFLESRGHTVYVQSRLRARWIYFKPWLWAVWAKDFIGCIKKLRQDIPDVWLTYHTYYKAPDLLGPWICKICSIKYIIFQGIYSTKRKRRLKTLPGFYLNFAALIRADHIFTNKLADFKNLKRIIPKHRLTYIRPGILPKNLKKNDAICMEQRKEWQISPECPVILTAAMFRDDVKFQGLAWLIRCSKELVRSNFNFHLVIAGHGKMEDKLKKLAQKHIPGCFTFAGKISREHMYRFYSAGDIFAFPGIRESLGMVYLEAQSCGLPVVAFKNGGIPEVVVHRETGFLVPMYDCKNFSRKLACLLSHDTIRNRMGQAAAEYVMQHHDIEKNYLWFEKILQDVVG